MSGIWLWVRSEWRRGWHGALALALLIALAGGVSMAVAAGARRADTAIARFMGATNHPQAGLEMRFDGEATEVEERLASLPTPDELADRLAAVPGVDGLSVIGFIGATPEEGGEFFSAAIAAERGEGQRQFLVAGRRPDPGNPHEVVVNKTAAAEWGSIGETLTLHTLDPSQLAVMGGFESGEPHGPDIDVRVVGIVRDIESITDLPEPILVTNSAFMQRYDDKVLMMPGVVAVTADGVPVDRLVDDLGAAAGDAFSAHAADEDFAGRADDAISVEVGALLAFSVAATLAGLAVIGLAMRRQCAEPDREWRARRAIGFTRRDHILGSMLRMAPAITVGAIGATCLAVALSPLFPRGLARRAEPALGILLDVRVLVLGTSVLFGACAALAAATSWFATRPAASRTARTSPVVVGRAGSVLPPELGLGLRAALAPQGRWGQAGWAGIIGVAVAVAGTVAVTAVDRSAERLQSTPRLFGAGWDAIIGLEPDGATGELAAELAADPSVAAVGRQEVLGSEEIDATGPGGSLSVDPEAFEPIVGAIGPTVTAGRLPAGPSEVAIGATVAATLGADIGDTISVAGYRRPVSMVVVGRVLDAGTTEVGNGFAVTRAGLDAMTAGCPAGSDDERCIIKTQGLGVSFVAGVDRDEAMAGLAEVSPGIMETPLPGVVNNLDQIGSTPWLVAGFLGMLGMAGLLYAMVVGRGRRDHDLAVGQALGLRPRQLGASVGWQALTLTAVGAAAGIVAGIVAGRLLWQRVALGTGAMVETALPAWAVLAPTAAAIVVALIIAVPSGWRATRLRPSVVLRSE